MLRDGKGDDYGFCARASRLYDHKSPCWVTEVKTVKTNAHVRKTKPRACSSEGADIINAQILQPQTKMMYLHVNVFLLQSQFKKRENETGFPLISSLLTNLLINKTVLIHHLDCFSGF